MFHTHVKRRRPPVCTLLLALLKVIIWTWLSQTSRNTFSTFCSLFKTNIMPKWEISEREKPIHHCNQILKEKGRIWVWIFNFLIQIHITRLHLFCTTQVTSYFLQNEVFLQKLKLASLGNNNNDSSSLRLRGLFLIFFFPPTLRISFSICCLGSIKENSWLLRQKLAFF